MNRLTVDRYEVAFARDWQALAWDGHAAQKAQNRGTGSKAVDVVAIRTNGDSLILELTDYRGHALPADTSLAEETAIKVCHTIAGVNGAARCTDEVLFARSVESWRTGRRMTVALCADFDVPAPNANVRLQRRQVREGVIRTALKKRLGWLKAETVVCTSEALAREIPDVTLRSVRGGGRARRG